jgi:hypothetical protein
MSFPNEAVIIGREDIKETDILIEDRKLVAVDGSEVATRESNSARNSSFYFKLIESLASNIHGKQTTNVSEWSLEILKKATEKIVVLFASQQQGRRFVWHRQFPENSYVLLTRSQTINKLANDLRCQMRQLDALAVTQASVEEQQQRQPSQLLYAQLLIQTVCTAARSGDAPYRAARLLDRPPIQPQESSSLAKVETNVAPQGDDFYKRYKESPQERSLRLQLRHRYLAVVRANQSIYDFSNTLLRAWGLPEFGKKQKKKKGEESTRDSSVAAARKLGRMSKGTTETAFDCVHGLPPSLVLNSNMTKERGNWRAAERKALLKAYEHLPVREWKTVSVPIPSR